jgi:hypothetical protein
MNEESQDTSFSVSFKELSEVGNLTKEIDWCGYKFVIKTLSTYEELVVAKIVKEYNETIGQLKATYAAIVAASIVSVNGVPFYPLVLNEDVESNIRKKFFEVGNWAFVLVEELAGTQLTLTKELIDEVELLKKKYSKKTGDFSDISNYLTEKESSLED